MRDTREAAPDLDPIRRVLDACDDVRLGLGRLDDFDAFVADVEHWLETGGR